MHASLLLIFLGGIVDALYGWRGFVMLTRGEQSSQVKPQNGSPRTCRLPFAARRRPGELCRRHSENAGGQI